ncbi:hypothetical protein ACKS2O_002481 [Cronobacter dublinensis]
MSTISNERLEEIAEEDNGSDVLFESSVLARELLTLRKEREQAEPVYQCMDDGKWYDTEKRLYDEVKENGNECRVLYTAPPAPSHENVHYADAAEEEIAALRKRIAELETAQTATVVHDAATAIRACLDEFPESVHDIVEECADIAENASRAAMIKSAMQPCDKCGLTGIHACMGGMEADTTAQQFESLAGKALVPAGWKLVPIELTKEMRGKIHPFAEATCLNCGRQVVADCEDNVTASWNDMLAVAPAPVGKQSSTAEGNNDGFECTPVADLYELLTKCGECYDYTTSAKVAADWIKEGYSAQEYVKLDRLQEALLFAAPEPCK